MTTARPATLGQVLFAEAVATGALLAAVIGSGIMGEALAGGNAALALLANALATAGALYVLIEVFAPVSGAHMNPAVSVACALDGRLPWTRVPAMIAAQCGGAVCGAWLAHAMFDLPILQWSSHLRSSEGQWLSEVVATAGLVLVVMRVPRTRVAAAVASYIGAAYWFTASTAFANPAVTLARMLTDTFAGIAPASAPAFLLAQVAGVGAGIALHRALDSRFARAEAVAAPPAGTAAD